MSRPSSEGKMLSNVPPSLWSLRKPACREHARISYSYRLLLTALFFRNTVQNSKARTNQEKNGKNRSVNSVHVHQSMIYSARFAHAHTIIVESDACIRVAGVGIVGAEHPELVVGQVAQVDAKQVRFVHGHAYLYQAQ